MPSASRRRLPSAARFILLLIVFSLVVWGLWNTLVPSIFGLRSINFWQALGLLVLSRILFGGFNRRQGLPFLRRHHMIQRWEKMSPEERASFRRGLRGQGRHHGPSPGEPTGQGHE